MNSYSFYNSLYFIDSRNGWAVGTETVKKWRWSGSSETEEEFGKQEKLKIFPNPAKEILYVVVDQTRESGESVFYHAQGQILMRKKSNEKQTQVNIRCLPKGLCFVKSISEYNVEVGTFMKE